MLTVIQLTWERMDVVSEYAMKHWMVWLKSNYPDSADFAYGMDLGEHYSDLTDNFGGCRIDFTNQKIIGAYERSTDEFLFNKLIAMFFCAVVMSDPLINTDNIIDLQFLEAKDTSEGSGGFLYDIDYK